MVERVGKNDLRISAHGYEELVADRIEVRDVLDGIGGAVLIREYRGYAKGPCVLVLQRDSKGRPVHFSPRPCLCTYPGHNVSKEAGAQQE